MCTRPTPAVTAATDDLIFGIMPSVMVPASISASAPAGSRRRSTVPSLSTPSMSEMNSRASASSAVATRNATVSALTLMPPPTPSSQTGLTTGTNPASVSVASRRVSTPSMRPVRVPGGTASGCAARVGPSDPQMPTALTPAALSARTSRLLALPASTMSTTSISSAVVRRMPLWKRGSCPRRRLIAVTSAPPPCTTITRHVPACPAPACPPPAREASSAAKTPRSAASSSARPPSLITAVRTDVPLPVMASRARAGRALPAAPCAGSWPAPPGPRRP